MSNDANVNSIEAAWIQENIEEPVRTALGHQLAIAFDLFPRLVNSTYIQMISENTSTLTEFNTNDFRNRVSASLPASIAEVTPFFVRAVWNQKWNPETHADQIRNLALSYSELLEKNGSAISTEDLIEQCRIAFRESNNY